MPPMRQGTRSTASAPKACAARSAFSVAAKLSSNLRGSSLLNSAQPRSTEWTRMPSFSAARRLAAASSRPATPASTPSKPAALNSSNCAAVGAPPTIMAFLSTVLKAEGAASAARAGRVRAAAAARLDVTAMKSRRFRLGFMGRRSFPVSSPS